MDNFTPLRLNKKKKINKFLVVGNISMFLILFFMTSFVLKDRLIPTQQKAIEPVPTQIIILTATPTLTSTPTPTITPALTEFPTPMITQELTLTPVVTQELITTTTPTPTIPK